MTNIIEEAEDINKFLCQIKKSLPLRIRLRKEELNDILDEIEEHIWEKAIENAGNKEPNEIDVQIAISQMGDPIDIASKFTSRSTPHVYISEELYPTYRKYRKILFWAFILSITLYTLFLYTDTFFYNFDSTKLFFFNIGTIMVIYFTFFITITLIFCNLSNTGYIPYKLRKTDMKKRNNKITSIQLPKFQNSFPKIALCLEIFSLLLISIVLNFWVFNYPFLLILAVVKGLRGFIKKKSIIWQKSLILVDIFFTILFFRCTFGTYYYQFDKLSFWHNEPLDKLIYVSSILCLLLYIYILYEVYLFSTLKEKLEFYLKKVSLNKRINKKEIILGTIKKDNKLKEQNIPLEKKTLTINGSKYDNEFEKALNAYLKTAKKKLPYWLKKKEKHEIIKTVEEEIRESTTEFKERNTLKQKILLQNINDLGILNIILSEYKKQGTPKLYISKELWPWYLTSLKLILTYFLIISIFIIVLQTTSIGSFDFFLLYPTICFLGFPILILVTYFFIFLSLNDFIPENNDFATIINNIAIRKYFYYIWEAVFIGFYIGIYTFLISNVFFGKFSVDFPGAIYVILLSELLLFLAGIKTLKLIIKNKVKLKSALIILSVLNCLFISFIILNNLIKESLIIIYFISVSKLSVLLFIPINIEILYEIFHFFFKTKKLSD